MRAGVGGAGVSGAGVAGAGVPGGAGLTSGNTSDTGCLLLRLVGTGDVHTMGSGGISSFVLQ